MTKKHISKAKWLEKWLNNQEEDYDLASIVEGLDNLYFALNNHIQSSKKKKQLEKHLKGIEELRDYYDEILINNRKYNISAEELSELRDLLNNIID